MDLRRQLVDNLKLVNVVVAVVAYNVIEPTKNWPFLRSSHFIEIKVNVKNFISRHYILCTQVERRQN